jgi:hypothetical protein
MLQTPLLGERSLNITKEIACIIKIFEDFRLVSQIREEIEKDKHNLISLIPRTTSF